MHALYLAQVVWWVKKSYKPWFIFDFEHNVLHCTTLHFCVLYTQIMEKKAVRTTICLCLLYLHTEMLPKKAVLATIGDSTGITMCRDIHG